MKKSSVVLILSAVCVAILFAQEAAHNSEPVMLAVPQDVSTVLVAVTNADPVATDIVSVRVKNVQAVTGELSVVEENIPAAAEEVFVVVEKIPVVEEAPAVVIEAPAIIEEAPAINVLAIVEEAPAVVIEVPAVVEEISAVAEDSSAVVDVMVEEEDEPEVDVIGIADDLTAGAQIAGGLISLSLKDVEIQDVVRLFSRLSNANIIVPDMVGGETPKRIDVNLDNVEWKPALKAILDTHSLELVEKIPGSEVYSIRERAADAPEPIEIKVYKLDYATVNEVVLMVKTLVTKEGGQISTYPARNSIVAQGSAKLLNDLERIITAVDLPREQVFIEAKFLELSDSASEQLGIDWNVLGGYKVGVGSMGGTYSYDQSSVDNKNKFRDISGSSYESLDTAPKEVEWVEDEQSSADNPLDPKYDFYNGIDYPGRLDSAISRIYGVIPTAETIDSSTVGKTLGAALSADDFNVVMSALKEMNGARVVSNPKIIVANEETATIQIGQKKPNIKGMIQTAGDSQVNRVYALDDNEPYFEDGVKVEVTPTVNTKDNITVRIQPTLDRLDADPTTAPDGTDFWGKSTKTIDTVFGLQSGQTAAIGGLTEASKSNVERKVPLLGDLPVLGRFFSYSSKSRQQVETIIFVTVGLANPQNLEFETGLPEDSTLAMRHRVEATANRAIEREELTILKAVEAERLQGRLNSLREAEKKRLEKLNK